MVYAIFFNNRVMNVYVQCIIETSNPTWNVYVYEKINVAFTDDLASTYALTWTGTLLILIHNGAKYDFVFKDDQKRKYICINLSSVFYENFEEQSCINKPNLLASLFFYIPGVQIK